MSVQLPAIPDDAYKAARQAMGEFGIRIPKEMHAVDPVEFVQFVNGAIERIQAHPPKTINLQRVRDYLAHFGKKEIDALVKKMGNVTVNTGPPKVLPPNMPQEVVGLIAAYIEPESRKATLEELGKTFATPIGGAAYAEAFKDIKSVERLQLTIFQHIEKWLNGALTALVPATGEFQLVTDCNFLHPLFHKASPQQFKVLIQFLRKASPQCASLDLSFLGDGKSAKPKVDDEVLAELALFPNLTSLNLSGCRHDGDSMLEKLKSLTNLTHLMVADCWVTNTGCETIKSHFTKLVYLDLSNNPQINDTGLASVGSLQHLESLNISNLQQVGNNGLREIAKCTTLKSLKLYMQTEVTDAGIAHLASLTNLKTLEIVNCQGIGKSLFTSALKTLRPLKELEVLSVESCERLSNSDLDTIGTFVKLKKLNLGGIYNICAKGLKKLKNLRGLNELNIAGMDGITDSVIKEDLAPFSKLTHLVLRFNQKITGKGLEFLGTHCTQLKQLKLIQVVCDFDAGYVSAEVIGKFRQQFSHILLEIASV